MVILPFLFQNKHIQWTWFFFGLAIKFNIFSLQKQRAKWLTFCINKNKFSSWAESNLTAAAAMMEWMLSITWLVWPTYITKKQDWKTNLLRAFWFLYIQANEKHKVSQSVIHWEMYLHFPDHGQLLYRDFRPQKVHNALDLFTILDLVYVTWETKTILSILVQYKRPPISINKKNWEKSLRARLC